MADPGITASLSAAKQWISEHRSALGWGLGAAALLGFFVLSRTVEVDTYVGALREWVSGYGALAPLAYGVLFVAATLLAFPGTPFTVLAPFLFGTGKGFVVMVLATTASAAAGFLISRHLLRDALEARFGETETYRKLQSLLEGDHWIAIPFVRLMPMFPFTFNNFAFGLSRISFWRYLLWSELVMIPMNAVLVLGAGALYSAMVRGEASWGLIGGTVGAAALVLTLGFAGKRIMGDGS